MRIFADFATLPVWPLGLMVMISIVNGIIFVSQPKIAHEITTFILAIYTLAIFVWLSLWSFGIF